MIAVLRFQTCRQSGFVNITNGRQIIVADPLPQPQLQLRHDRCIVHQLQDRLYLVTLRFLVVQPHHNADIFRASAKRHKYTTTDSHRHTFRHDVGKNPMKGYGQYQISVQHDGDKGTKKLAGKKYFLPFFIGYFFLEVVSSRNLPSVCLGTSNGLPSGGSSILHLNLTSLTKSDVVVQLHLQMAKYGSTDTNVSTEI